MKKRKPVIFGEHHYFPAGIGLRAGINIQDQGEILTVVIDKEYFRKRFEKVFEKWEQISWHGMDKEKTHELLEELMKCFDEETD